MLYILVDIISLILSYKSEKQLKILKKKFYNEVSSV